MFWPETSGAAGTANRKKNYYKKTVTLGRRLLTRALKADCKKGIKSTFPKGKNETKAEFFNLVVHYLVTITSSGCP